MKRVTKKDRSKVLWAEDSPVGKIAAMEWAFMKGADAQLTSCEKELQALSSGEMPLLSDEEIKKLKPYCAETADCNYPFGVNQEVQCDDCYKKIAAQAQRGISMVYHNTKIEQARIEGYELQDTLLDFTVLNQTAPKIVLTNDECGWVATYYPDAPRTDGEVSVMEGNPLEAIRALKEVLKSGEEVK